MGLFTSERPVVKPVDIARQHLFEAQRDKLNHAKTREYSAHMEKMLSERIRRLSREINQLEAAEVKND